MDGGMDGWRDGRTDGWTDLTTIVFHLQKFNSHYILCLISPSLSANIFTNPKGGG